MFSEIFDIVFGTYRVTEARIKYIRAPSDNRQREAEDPEMAQALYASAADFYAEFHGEYPSERTKMEFEAEQQLGLTADDILQLEIYKLSEEVLSNERYSKPHGPRL
jgi:hypothetical protein